MSENAYRSARVDGTRSVFRIARARNGCVPVTVTGTGSDLLVRPDWAALGGALPGRVATVRFSGPRTDYHLDTPAGTVMIREAGPPRLAVGDAARWVLRREWLV